MRVEIRSKDLHLAEALRVHLERRLLFALGRFDGRIRRVTVRLADVNGPRGGVDKRCHVSLMLSPGGNVVLEEKNADLVAAIDRAADRLGHAVARKLHRAIDVRCSVLG
jgi:ribosome hibernation promoting factor